LACPQASMVGTMLWPRSMTAADHLSFDFALSVLPRVASSMTLDDAAGKTAALNGFDGVVFMIQKVNTEPASNNGSKRLTGRVVPPPPLLILPYGCSLLCASGWMLFRRAFRPGTREVAAPWVGRRQHLSQNSRIPPRRSVPRTGVKFAPDSEAQRRNSRNRTLVARGTGISNPSPSTTESDANFTQIRHRRSAFPECSVIP
jgi:hypothetical protein